MSGHSKWHKLKHKKAITDSKKSKVFGQLAHDIKKAAESGPNPTKNSQLREAIERARTANMPQSNIDRLLQSSNQERHHVTYEGYGAHGVAFLLTAYTDNTNRTVSQVRAIFKRHSGNLGEPGSVRWKFQEHSRTSGEVPASLDREIVELKLIDAGAEDISYHDSRLIVTTAIANRSAIEAVMISSGITTINSTTNYAAPPDQQILMTPTQQDNLKQLQNELADHPDIVAIFTNAAPFS